MAAAPASDSGLPSPPPAQQELVLRQQVRRLSWSLVFDAVLGFFNLESAFGRTLRDFLLRPRQAFVSYLGAERLRYSNPLKLLITLVAMATFLNYVGGNFDAFTEGFSGGVETSHPDNPLTFEQQEALSQFIQRNYNLFVLAGLPALSLATWVVYCRRTYNFVEHLALNSFIIAVTTAVYVLIFIPTVLFPLAVLPYGLAVIAYQTWVYRRVLGPGWIRAFFATCLGTAIYMVVFVVAIGVYFTQVLRPA